MSLQNKHCVGDIVTDHCRQAFPLKLFLVSTVVMGGKVELDSTFPTVLMAGCRSYCRCWNKMFPYVCTVTQTITNHDCRIFHIIWKPGLSL